MKARGTRIIASAEAQDAAGVRKLHDNEVAAFIAAETKSLRESRKDDELARVSKAKEKRRRELTGAQKVEVLHTDGRSRTVKRVNTTASKMMTSGKLPRDLYNQLTAFARVVARALGAAVDDGDDSTSRLTAQYDGMPGGAHGSKTPSDSILDARTALREIGRLIPPELQAVFVQIVGEEVGSFMGKPKTLDQLGDARGYHHKQASASGGTQVYDVIALIAHLAKLRGVLSRENIIALRQNAATETKSLTSQGVSGDGEAGMRQNNS